MNKIFSLQSLVLVLTCTVLLWGFTPVFAVDGQTESGTEPHETEHGVTEESDSHAEEHSTTLGEHGEQAAEAHGTEHGAHHGTNLGEVLPLWSALPFVGILLSIALFPLFAPSFWHHHFPKVSAFWALVFAIPFLIAYGGDALYEILHIYLADYFPFIILLWGLFAASGGILLRGSLAGTPRVNLVMLIIGTILASWMGTTGASMLLIRPVIRANKKRKNKMHVIIFFIFLVSNIGGSLTPLGDPPLFLGFLHGVPFFWTFSLMPQFLTVSLMLLAVFFILDTILYNKEKDELKLEENKEKEPLKLEGLHNIIFLGGVLGAVLFSGMVQLHEVNIGGVHIALQNIIRDLFICFMVFLSVKTTSKKIRQDNEFSWFPIKEVAYLFAGIFMTIIPALAMLRESGSEHGSALTFIADFVQEPAHYFWIAGALSSFLDNAPTYLTFFNLALGKLEMVEDWVNPLLSFPLNENHPLVLQGIITLEATAEQARSLFTMEEAQRFIRYLTGISVGAVFFGAMTYIGNAPNFMVRSIAEENKIKMPSFFGYMIWSLAILIPCFIVVTFIFFL